MSEEERVALARALNEWKDAGGDIMAVIDAIREIADTAAFERLRMEDP